MIPIASPQYGRSAMRKIRYQQIEELKQKKDSGLLKLEPKTSFSVVTEDRLYRILDDLEKYYELWLSYPDKLTNLLLPIDTTFKFYPYQTLALRTNLRFKKTSFTATRGASKSFIAIFTKFIKCVLLPGVKETIVAETKAQAAKISKEKVEELFSLMPLLREEINFKKGSGTTVGDDYVKYKFKNGSELDVVYSGTATRGGRRHGLLAEEIQNQEAQPFNEVILPLLNISRRMKTGELNPNELHQQINYVGTASHINTFGHDKTVEVLLESIVNPSNAFCWGMDYRIPVYYGLLNEEFIESIRNSNTYEESSFAREFMSKWTSTIEGSLFDYDKLNRLRTLKKAEWRAYPEDDVYYILSVDVARTSARTIAEVLKVRRGQNQFRINVVNIFSMEGRNFLYQAAELKRLHSAFGFQTVVIDTNGLGVGLVDFLMTETAHPESGFPYPPWNVQNIDKYPSYIPDQKIGAESLIHIIKTNQHSAGKFHTTAFNMLFSGRVKFLIDEKTAKDSFSIFNKTNQKPMALNERLRRMEPYKNTTLLINETSNLKINRVNTYFKLELINTSLEKDTYSALSYGLGVIDEQEKKYYSSLRKKRPKLGRAVFFN